MNQLSSEQNTLLILLRRSLWGDEAQLPAQIDWDKVDAIADAQGVRAFAYDGAVKLGAVVPAELLEKWHNKMLRGAVRNEQLLIAQDKIADWFAQAGIPAVILKGGSVSRYYPKPELRVLGDIDILVNKADMEKAGSILEAHGYVSHGSDHDFHLSFLRRGVCVELHYNVTAFPDSEGGRISELEATHFLDKPCQGVVAEHVFPVLAEEHQAMSLLLHMVRHMFSTGIGLRQVSDWAMYIAVTDGDYFVNVTIPLLERCGLLRYAKVATRSCVKYLGLPDKGLSWCEDVMDVECAAFMEETFRAGNMGVANKEGSGDIFINSSAMGTHEMAATSVIARLTEITYKNFPFVRKYKLLLPVFWVYLPVRYLVRSLLGKRPKKSVVKLVVSGQKQRNIYEILRPFELDR